MHVLVTGGLGFIGSRIAQRHLAAGDSVTILDSLHKQVHQDDAAVKALRAAGARVLIGDVAERASMEEASANVDWVYHMAAETGTGQSMNEIARYCDANVRGTALLCELLIENPKIARVLLPSSRAIYGEGAHMCSVHGVVFPRPRDIAAMKSGDFSARCPVCGERTTPASTSEDAPAQPASIYASTKKMQEWLLEQTCGWTQTGLRIVRYQNVYGPGQSLGNPYTGVLAIFAQQIASGQTLNIYEDGLIGRDFVYIDDVVSATMNVMYCDDNATKAINIGSGKASTLFDVIAAFGAAFGREIPYRVSGDFRPGDIRFAVADIARYEDLFGKATWVTLKDGIAALLTSL